MGLGTWTPSEGLSPPSGLEEFFSAIPDGVSLAIWILVPLVVGRWWVIAALAGPVVALAALQATGHEVQQFEGWYPPLTNPFTIFGLLILALVMLALVGIRKVFDFWRGRRATAGS
jgi:hypothetical protein